MPEDFSDYWTTGFYNVGGGITYSLSTMLSLRMNVDWCNFSFEGRRFLHDRGYTGWTSFRGGAVSVLCLTMQPKISFPGNVARPYILGGGGFVLLSGLDNSVTWDDLVINISGTSENAPCIDVGLGMDIQVTDAIDFFVDSRYVLAFTKGQNTSFVPMRAGIELGL